MSPAERVAALSALVGQAVTLRRVQTAFPDRPWEPARTTVDYPARASLRAYRANEVIGAVRQGDREARIAARELPVTPTSEDKLVVEGKELAILAVDTRRLGAEDVLHILQVRG